jgi:phosphatidylinositol alpha-1,6-mannosyltransferase
MPSIIAPEFPPSLGGMQVMALNLALELSKRHQVTAFTRRNQTPSPSSFKTTPLLEADVDRDAAGLGSANVDVWLAMNAGYSVLVGRLEKPMAVYCHGNDFLSPWVIGAPRMIDHLQRMPHVWRYAEPLRQAWRRRAVMRGLLRSSAVLANSDYTRNLLTRKFGVPEARIRIIYPGVEDRFFQARPARSGGPLKILTVSRLESRNRRKNVDGVLRAIGLLKNEVDVRYTVVGEGSDMPRLVSLARELGIADRVNFTGRLDEPGILKAYREADLFVLAAKAAPNDIEGFGIVYVEANASGVPVLCSRRGGAVDAVRDGETGILIDDAEPAGIADGIRKFKDISHIFDPAKLASCAEGFRWSLAAGEVEAALVSITGDCNRLTTTYSQSILNIRNTPAQSDKGIVDVDPTI